MKCIYAKIIKRTDIGIFYPVCVCRHPMYETKLKAMADALSKSGKNLIPNKECQFVRDIDCKQCPLYKENC